MTDDCSLRKRKDLNVWQKIDRAAKLNCGFEITAAECGELMENSQFRNQVYLADFEDELRKER